MRGPITVLPLATTALALAGALGATLYLHREARGAVERVLDERLGAAGASAALLLEAGEPSSERLRALRDANGLDAVYVVAADRRVLADATGAVGRKADLLRLDMRRLSRALEGTPSVGVAFDVEQVRMRGGYFPLTGSTPSVLVLEGGRAFAGALESVDHARNVGVGLSVLGALALGAVSFGWARVQRERRAEAERSARAEALTRVAAMAAHEIRNPLGIIRGTVELMRERSRSALSQRDGQSLEDVLGEVERLRRLTDDLLELSADRPLHDGEVPLFPLLDEVGRATRAAYPEVQVQLSAPPDLRVRGDAVRLRQAVLNLLLNAAQAQEEGEIRITAQDRGPDVVVRIEDDGPGLPDEVRARLFEPFITTRARGTGLGLSVARRLVERMGGTLELVDVRRTTFELCLPRPGQEGAP